MREEERIQRNTPSRGGGRRNDKEGGHSLISTMSTPAKWSLIFFFHRQFKRKEGNTTNGPGAMQQKTAAIKCGRAFLGPSTFRPLALCLHSSSGNQYAPQVLILCTPEVTNIFSRLLVVEFPFGSPKDAGCRLNVSSWAYTT